MGKLPTFIGIGAPKTATTFLDSCLRQHPDVFMSTSKEPHYFSKFSDSYLGEYQKFFEGADGPQQIGEISTSYLHSPIAPERIHRLIPDVKLFVSVRNPADQVYSHYWQAKRHNFYQSDSRCVTATFPEAVQRYPERLIEAARYAKHLKRWLDLFDASKIHIIFYEDIQRDARGVLRELFRFLGIADEVDIPCLRNEGRVVLGGVRPRSERVEKLYGKFYVGLNNYVFWPLKRRIGYKNAMRLKDALKVRSVLGRIFFVKGYPPASQEDRRLIIEMLETDIGEMEVITGRDLREWRK